MIEIIAFLTVLIIALVIGNVLLSLTSPNKSTAVKSPTENVKSSVSTNSSIYSNGNGSSNSIGLSNSINSTPLYNSSAFDQLNQLNRRIDRVENLLLKINNSDEVAIRFAELKLTQKVNDLVEYRQNSRIEIEALKEKISAIEETFLPHSSEKPLPSRENFSENDDEKFQRKIHEIIYHSRK